MEFQELKTLWQQYDNRLDSLERMNRKLVKETLLAKPERKLDWMRMQNAVSILIGPIVIVITLHPYLTKDMGAASIAGWFLIAGTVAYLSYVSFRSYRMLKQVDLANDTVLESARKINNYHDSVNGRKKFALLSYATLFTAVMLILGPHINYTFNTLIYFAGVLVFMVVLGYRQFKAYGERMAVIEREIREVAEYE